MTDYISRADAIEAVRGLSVLVDDDDFPYFEDALNALPSAELPKGDLISRADVLKYPIRLNHYDEENGSREFVYGVESVIEYVASLPSDDAVHGEWIIVGHDIYECSLCQQNVMTKNIDCYSYCHRCGAKMQNGFKSVGQAWNTEQRR